MSLKQKFAELIYFILFTFAVIWITLNLSSCEKDEDCPGDIIPQAPYGTPDDKSTYNGEDGYMTVDYTYYCRNGKFEVITYTRDCFCCYWKKTNYSSSGVCK